MRMLRLVGAITALGLLIGVSQTTARAQAQSQSFTLEPGGTAVVQFEAFCIEFGEEFPETGLQAPNGVAPDPVRGALAYAQSRNLTANEQQALQVQYAVWRALGETTSPQGDQTAQDVLANGTTAPAAPQGATSVVDAARQNQVQITIDQFQPVGQPVQITPASQATDNFYGRGQLTIRNTSQQTQTLYMPIGTVFPAQDAQFQDLAGYATDVQVNNPQQQAAQQAQQQAQQRLPTTSDGAQAPLAALVLLGTALIVTGYVFQRPQRRRS
jgi:hypothetical protein